MNLKKMMKKAAAVLLSAGMLVSMGIAASAEGIDWNHSKSKTATNLDANFESNVTLSLPSAEEQLVTDVVFVLDKSTSPNIEAQIQTLLDNLNAQFKSSGAKINVGVVIFNREANTVLGLTELNDANADAIHTAIATEIKSGTNLHAGLMAGKEMLDNDSSVPAERKYLITVSDGITYLYNTEPTVTSVYWLNDNSPYYSRDPYSWQFKYGNNNAPASWGEWIVEIGNIIGNSNQGEIPYDAEGSQESSLNASDMDASEYYTSIDKALYLSYQTYQEAKGEGYHCYAVAAETGTSYAWGPSFMNFLADGETCDFTAIQNDIYYLLDAGSYVEDYMGYVEGNYNFDFLNDASKLSMKVGDEVLAAETISENEYGFGQTETGYAYTVKYEKGNGQDDEHFTWNINVPVSNFAPVQLNYTVKLVNPKTEAGTYGQYDADGTLGYPELYTNNSAVLYPVDSNSAAGGAEEFQKPTVSYTVEKQIEEQPTTPKDPEPAEKPAKTEKPKTNTSKSNAPKTGDESSMLVWEALALISVMGLVAGAAYRRRNQRG